MNNTSKQAYETTLNLTSYLATNQAYVASWRAIVAKNDKIDRALAFGVGVALSCFLVSISVAGLAILGY